jgi:hypothetical protein
MGRVRGAAGKRREVTVVAAATAADVFKKLLREVKLINTLSWQADLA